MKTHVLAALFLVSTLTASTAAAQLAPYNEAGVTMGHWHLATKDVEAEKKLFLAMGGKLYIPGGQPLIGFPGLYISLILGTEKGEGGTVGSVVNHVGFIVDNVQQRVARVEGRGREGAPGRRAPDGGTGWTRRSSRRRTACAWKSWKTRRRRCRSGTSTSTSSLPAAEIPKAMAWYAKTFGGRAGTRNNAPVVDLPGVQLRFNTADTKQAPTRGRVLDHFGFDVRDHAAFVKRLEAQGIKLDQPVGKGATGNTITYITDPWGTRIEIVQRLPVGPQVQQTN